MYLDCMNINNLVVILNCNIARYYYSWEKMGKWYTRCLFFFLKLHVNLQFPLNKCLIKQNVPVQTKREKKTPKRRMWIENEWIYYKIQDLKEESRIQVQLVINRNVIIITRHLWTTKPCNEENTFKINIPPSILYF